MQQNPRRRGGFAFAEAAQPRDLPAIRTTRKELVVLLSLNRRSSSPGATDGLGRALASELTASGATLLIHGRDQERGRRVAFNYLAG